MKKIISILFVFVMCFGLVASGMQMTVHASESSVWDGKTITKPTSMKTIEGVYYYEISSPEELAYIAKTGGDWLTYNYVLVNDIVLNAKELACDSNGNLTVNAASLNRWTPISQFTGIFDGAGHSVSGVYVSTDSAAGFFLDVQGVIKNLTIQNSYIKGTEYVGGICATYTKTGAEFSNCKFYGVVKGVYYVGGLIGSNDCTNIDNCINYGNVYGEGHVGGIVGKFEAYEILNCQNYGKITATGDYAGGITGLAYYPISGCTNYGDVSGYDYVGGIFGHIFWGSDVSECGNLGNITGHDFVGGLVGDNSGLWENTDIIDSYNTGSVKGNKKVGGLAGNISFGDINNSLNVGNVTGAEFVGAVIGNSDTVWGKGTVTDCFYLKTEAINTNLTAFGNTAEDTDVAIAKDASYFCIKEDKTLSVTGHTYEASDSCDATCTSCGYRSVGIHTYSNVKYDVHKHWYECGCGERKADSEELHMPSGPATDTEASVCVVCGYVIEPAYNAPAIDPDDAPVADPDDTPATKPIPNGSNANDAASGFDGAAFMIGFIVGFMLACVVVIIIYFTQKKKILPATSGEVAPARTPVQAPAAAPVAAPENIGTCLVCGRENTPVQMVDVQIANAVRKRAMCAECAAKYK